MRCTAFSRRFKKRRLSFRIFIIGFPPSPVAPSQATFTRKCHKPKRKALIFAVRDKKRIVLNFVCIVLSNTCKKPAWIIMKMQPEFKQEHRMYAGPLQHLEWHGCLHEKMNDLRSRTMRNLDASHHDADCGLNDLHSRIPCSCCRGAQTFEEARHVEQELLQVSPSNPGKDC